MQTRNIKFFFNAIYYGFWLIRIKIDDIMGKLTLPLTNFIAKYLFPKKLRTKYFHNRDKNISQYEAYVSDIKYGSAIILAKWVFDYSTYAYGFLISIPFGIYFSSVFNWNSNLVSFLLFALPCVIIGVPIYRVTHSKDHYLHYFEKFEKKDDYWKKKWRRYASFYLLGGFLSIPIGIALLILITICFK